MKKLFKVMGVVAICAAFAVVVYNQVNAKPENSILAKNIEALSDVEATQDEIDEYCLPYCGATCYIFYVTPYGNEVAYAEGHTNKP